MNIHLYAKTTEKISSFDDTLNLIRCSGDSIFISVENKRCFRELEKIKELCKIDDAVMVSSLSSLGMNRAEISNQLEWFIQKTVALIICDVPSSYEYGVSQPINKAVLSAIQQSVVCNSKNIVEILQSKRSNSGRNRIEFPDNWDELYELWNEKEISSTEFIRRTGLKKATFYNMLTEYKEIKKLNEQYIKKYKAV